MKQFSFSFTRIQNIRTVILFVVLVMPRIITYQQAYGVEAVTKDNTTHTEEQYDPDKYFDEIWQIINDKFWDPNFNGVDWEDTGKRYRPKALVAEDHETFAVIVNQMLAELNTSHTRYYTKWEPAYYTLQATLISQSLATLSTSETSVLERFQPGRYSSGANPHRVGIGVVTKEIENRHYVIAVLARSPAEKADILLGDWLVAVNGQPFHPIRSFQNKAGHELELTIQRSPSTSTRHRLKIFPVNRIEKELFEGDSWARARLIEYKGHQFSYIRLWWLSGWRMRRALDIGLNVVGKPEGMIIDLRDGFGGGPVDEYIKPFLGNSREMVIIKSIGRNRVSTSTIGFNGPVVVLINGGSRSGKELLAYYVKKTGRGVLLGERTAGFVSAGSWRRISEDSLLYFCRSMLIIDGERLEGVGVEPDIVVSFDIRFAAGRDVQLERAKDTIVDLIETKCMKVPQSSQ